MGTTQVTAVLFQLQQLDLELDRLATEKQSITASLQGGATLRKLRTEYDTAQQQLKSALQTQKEAEWTLEDLTRRQTETERRLYNGSISNAKELQALQSETQRLHAQQNRQEEVLLEVIDAAEASAHNVERKLATLEKAEEEWRKERVVLQERLDQLENQVQERQKKRQGLVESLDGELVKRYDTLRRTKQGRAVSKVEQNSCQWCRVILTPSELQHVRQSRDIQTCMNCGRILYYER
jgi:predicted  nucleic acid-binding Zn-ribbon protein